MTNENTPGIQNEKKKQQKAKHFRIPLETQWAMHDFFMKTSAPRLVAKRREQEKKEVAERELE